LLLGGIAAFAPYGAGMRSAVAQTEVVRAAEQFDEIRALAMRALLRAQELRAARVYLQGFQIGLPEYVVEDLIVEGLWLFDYLNSMDTTAMSIISYAAALEHPNLEQELELFKAYIPEAARKTLAYYDRTSRMLAESVAKIKAAGRQRPYIETVPSQSLAQDASAGAIAGDGFNIGWTWPMIQEPSSTLGRHLTQHAYTQERIFKLAADAGIDFMRPEDRNLFDWIDVERQEGQYDWSRIDKLLNLCKKYDIALWLPLPSYNTGPPQWLRQRLKDRAVLTRPDGRPVEVPSRGRDRATGINDIRKSNNPPNLFAPNVAKPFARYIRKLIGHVKQSGVRIFAIQLGDRNPLPYYGGPAARRRWQEWLAKNKIDPRRRWNMAIDANEAGLPDNLETAGAAEPGRRRLLLDIVRWREDECVEYFRIQADAIRAVAPGLPICMQACDSGALNESMNGRPNERLIRELGLVSFGAANGANTWDDLRRSYSSGAWSATTAPTGIGDWPSHYACSSYIHGTLTILSAPVPIIRGFYSDQAYYYPDMRRQWSSLLGWRRFHERAQGMAPEMINTRPAPQAALLWSDTTNKYQSFIGDHAPDVPYGFNPGMANYHKLGCIGWGRILNSMWLAHDIVTERQVLEGKLGRYEMLVMPAVQAIPPDVAERIREFVLNGGSVVATSAPALFDADMEQRGGGQLADVLCADFDRFLPKSVVARSPMRNPRLDGQAFHKYDPDAWYRAVTQSDSIRTLYCTFKPRDVNRVSENFVGGDPAAVLSSPGEGKAFVIGYPIGREVFVSDPYSLHDGHNTPGRPNGDSFTRGLVEWFETRLREVGIKRKITANDERVARGPVDWAWTRRSGDYRDYSWDIFGTPRSIEATLRGREGNPNVYLTIFNREGGGGGSTPGVIHYESTSKRLAIDLRLGRVLHIFDLSLGCPVPFTQSRALPRGLGEGVVTSFRTAIEPSAARMFVISTDDDVIRIYSGNRRHGRSDEIIREAVRALATGQAPTVNVIIGPDDMVGFLADRAPDGISISAESPLYVPAAKRLAAALREEFGCAARVTRNSPRLASVHDVFFERPNILLGSHNESHHIAVHKIFYQSAADVHTARLPVLPSHTFPGPGRSIITLTRPFAKRRANQDDGRAKRWGEMFRASQLIIGASDRSGLEAGVDSLIKLIKSK